METRPMTELYDLEYDLGNLFAMRQGWANRKTFTMSRPRPTNGLVYFCGCSGKYYDADKKAELGIVKKGDLVLLPKGSTYTRELYGCSSETDAILFEFTLHGENGEEILFSPELFKVEYSGDGSVFGKLTEIADEYKSLRGCPAAIKSLAFGILSELSRTGYKSILTSKRFSPIKNAVVYLEGNYDKNPTVTELADMCAVSPACFRTLFKEYSGMTPTEFIRQGRLERAKKLLAVGSLSVAEIAERLGFYDSGHFCRFFKGATGMSPGEFIIRN